MRPRLRQIDVFEQGLLNAKLTGNQRQQQLKSQSRHLQVQDLRPQLLHDGAYRLLQLESDMGIRPLVQPSVTITGVMRGRIPQARSASESPTGRVTATQNRRSLHWQTRAGPAHRRTRGEMTFGRDGLHGSAQKMPPVRRGSGPTSTIKPRLKGPGIELSSQEPTQLEILLR